MRQLQRIANVLSDFYAILTLEHAFLRQLRLLLPSWGKHSEGTLLS